MQYKCSSGRNVQKLKSILQNKNDEKIENLIFVSISKMLGVEIHVDETMNAVMLVRICVAIKDGRVGLWKKFK